MEIFLIIFVLILLIALKCVEIFHLISISKRLDASRLRICKVLTDEIEKNNHLTIASISNLDRSLLALREPLEATKPMKSNNWDSVREAFKGPVRVELNERN